MAYEEQKAVLLDSVTISSMGHAVSDVHDFGDALVLNPHLWLEVTGFAGVIGDDDTMTIRILGVVDDVASPDTYLVWKPSGKLKWKISLHLFLLTTKETISLS